MKGASKMAAWAAAALYLGLLSFFAMDVRDAHRLKLQRMSDFSAFSEMYAKLPAFQPTARSSEPLLVRLQKSASAVDLKDRALKWSGKDATAGQTASVTLSVEGVPAARLADLLERLSAEPDVTVPSFRIERSGASKERFDFSATFAAASGPGLSAP